MSIYVCGGNDFHPYECSHDRYCEHCTLAETSWHNPSNCALCDWMDNGEPTKMCDEQFAIQIRVLDFSHNKRRVKVNRQIQGVLL